MTFNKMRFPIVWITFALLVVLCTFEVQCGPAGSRQDVDFGNFERSARQFPYLDDEGSEEDDDEGDEEQQLNFPASPNESGEGDDDDYSERNFRQRREAAQKPVVEEEETEEESVVPPVVPEKKPSVLELLSSALDKAIEATSKIPTQQVASDAAGVFQILGQVFSEAIDKVIGSDDGPEDNAAEVNPESSDNKVPEEPPVLPVNEEPMKVEEQQQPQQQEQEPSQSDKEIVNKL